MKPWKYIIVFAIKNGKIGTETRCSGRSERDPYKTCGTHLAHIGKEIHTITDWNVLAGIVLDCPWEKRWCFKSEHSQNLQMAMNNESANAEATLEITSWNNPAKKTKCACFDSLLSSKFCGMCKVW